jgi:hypothetical protein
MLMRYTYGVDTVYGETLINTSEENTINLAQRKAGSDFRRTARWHEAHVEILEGFGEITRVSDGGSGACGFDETRRRLRRGCFMVIDEASYVLRYSTVYSKSETSHDTRVPDREKIITPNGNRTRAACLEGKHDNHFTIGVAALLCHSNKYDDNVL